MNEGHLMTLPTVEGLVVLARGRVTAPTVTALANLGLYLDGDVEPMPADKWGAAIKLVAADLFPALPAEEAQRRLAHFARETFMETMLGRVLVAVARVLGHERCLQRMTHNLRTGSTFLEARYTARVDGVRELWINDVSDVPHYYRGLLEFGGDALGFPADEVDIIRRDGASCTYRLTRAGGR